MNRTVATRTLNVHLQMLEGDEAQRHLHALTACLTQLRLGAESAEFDHAFAHAAGALSTLRELDPRPNAADLRELIAYVPELREFVALAAAQVQGSASAGAVRLWAHLGFGSRAPSWEHAELDCARTLITLACMDPDKQLSALGRRLEHLTAGRWAGLLTDELSAGGESVWKRALGGRYDSVAHRCAPRTRFRTLGLCTLLERDELAGDAVRRQLTRWLADGGDLAALPSALEGALVHARSIERIA